MADAIVIVLFLKTRILEFTMFCIKKKVFVGFGKLDRMLFLLLRLSDQLFDSAHLLCRKANAKFPFPISISLFFNFSHENSRFSIQ